MIRFLREKQAVVGWCVVIFFGATLFTGSLFFGLGGGDGDKSSQKLDNHKDAIAVIGTEPLNPNVFQDYLNLYLRNASLKSDTGSLSPEVQELVTHEALLKSVEDQVMLMGANDSGLVLSKQDLNQALLSIIVELDLKNKKALKKRLKESGVSYKYFMDNVKNTVKTQQFRQSLIDSVDVSDQDVDNQFKEVNVSHLLISSLEEVGEGDKEVLAQTISDEIQSGKISFDDAVKRFSDDGRTRGSKGQLGWMKFGSIVSEFEDVAYTLKKEQVSRPFKTVYGYHIVKLNDVRLKKRPIDLDYDKDKKRLLRQKQEVSVRSYVQGYLSRHKLVIQDPFFKAYDSKIKGDFNGAISAYQLQVSKAPYNPAPHYFMAKIFQKIDDEGSYLKELEKAEIKADLAKQYAFPEMYYELATYYQSKKQSKKVAFYYNKVFDVVRESAPHLRVLKEKYMGINDKIGAEKVTRAIHAIEARQKILEESELASDNAELGVSG